MSFYTEKESIWIGPWKIPQIARMATASRTVSIIMLGLLPVTFLVGIFYRQYVPTPVLVLIQLIAALLGLVVIYLMQKSKVDLEECVKELVSGDAIWSAQDELLEDKEFSTLDSASLRMQLSKGEWQSSWEIIDSLDLLALVLKNEQIYLVRLSENDESQDSPNNSAGADQ